MRAGLPSASRISTARSQNQRYIAVQELKAVFGRPEILAARADLGRRGFDLDAVIGMDALQPPAGGHDEGIHVGSEHGSAAVDEHHLVLADVPVPDGVASRAGEELEFGLARCQGIRGAVEGLHEGAVFAREGQRIDAQPAVATAEAASNIGRPADQALIAIPRNKARRRAAGD